MNKSSHAVGFLHRPDLWISLLVLFSTLLLYWPAIGHDFVMLDDTRYVMDNPVVSKGITWEGVKTVCSSMQENLWIPLTSLSFMADVEWGGAKVSRFHAVNNLFHALNAMLVFILLRKWTRSRWLAVWAALIWAWHPLRVESVVWISGRKDVLSGLFFLLCLWTYCRSHEGPVVRKGWFWASVGFCALGLASKTTLVAVPFVLLLLDVWPLGRLDWSMAKIRHSFLLIAEKWAFWLMSAASGLLGWLGHSQSGSLVPDPLGTRIMRALLDTGFYLWRTLIPRNLSVLYMDIEITGMRVAAVILVIGMATWLAWRWRRCRPANFTGWFWYLGLLFPVSGIISFGAQSRADRYTYLPAIGLSLLAAAWGTVGKKTKTGMMILAMAGILSVTAAGLLTKQQIPVWRDSGMLLERALSVSPRHPVALLNYGVWLYSKGDLEGAQKYIGNAWKFQKASPQAERSIYAGSLGFMWVLQGRTAEAREILRPYLGDSFVNWSVPAAWGMALLYEGQAKDAIPYLQDALRRRPWDQLMMAELQRAYFEAGQKDEVRQMAEFIQCSVGLNYSTYDLLFPHYLKIWQLGGRRYAWRYFERLAGEVKSVQLLNNVAWLAATDPKTSPEIAAWAVVFARRAAEMTRGSNATVLDTLGAAQAAAGDFESAVKTGMQAMALAESKDESARAEKIRARIQLYRSGQPYRE